MNEKRIAKKRPKGTLPDWADSMKIAASQWGISMPVLKAAKAAGCPAFSGSRIRRTELIEWLKLNPTIAGEGEASASKAELENRKLAAQVANLELRNEKEKGILIKKTEAKDEWARAMAIVIEEAKSLITDKAFYRVFCERIKARIGEVLP